MSNDTIRCSVCGQVLQEENVKEVARKLGWRYFLQGWICRVCQISTDRYIKD